MLFASIFISCILKNTTNKIQAKNSFNFVVPIPIDYLKNSSINNSSIYK